MFCPKVQPTVTKLAPYPPPEPRFPATLTASMSAWQISAQLSQQRYLRIWLHLGCGCFCRGPCPRLALPLLLTLPQRALAARCSKDRNTGPHVQRAWCSSVMACSTVSAVTKRLRQLATGQHPNRSFRLGPGPDVDHVPCLAMSTGAADGLQNASHSQPGASRSILSWGYIPIGIQYTKKTNIEPSSL